MATRDSDGSLREFEILALAPGGSWDSGIAVAAARCGHVGLIDLTFVEDPTVASGTLERLRRLARGKFGCLLNNRLDAVLRVRTMLEGAEMVVLQSAPGSPLEDAVKHCRTVVRRVGVLITHADDALAAQDAGADFLIAKGYEAGGFVGDDTTFILIQKIRRLVRLPFYAWGGIGPGSAAACRIAGGSGVVLDWQLSLTKESPVPSRIRQTIAALDGSETSVVRTHDGRNIRFLDRPDMSAPRTLREASDPPSIRELRALVTEGRTDARLWLVGQDACFADISSKTGSGPATVANHLGWLQEEVQRIIRGCARASTLDENAPLAVSHGTRFPIVQGPMTRVSDSPAFCAIVEEGGALPFLALALMRQAEVRELLRETSALMGERPWGVGILGFVDKALRAEQIEVMEEICPPFAIIAGGQPAQAAELEAKGIRTYLHVPSPGLLAAFLREGARRFIFEGRECGGHVGPRSSFVLWETMVRVLLDAELDAADASDVHVLFAGGIHDAPSACMAAAIAQPLVERGAKFGVLMGTAYLFTSEAVDCGAIVPGFQEVALQADHTVLVESGPGHQIRCAETGYVRSFGETKRRLEEEGGDVEAVRKELDRLNIGRLRIASKGITRVRETDGSSTRATVSAEEQAQDGMYMLGQVASLRDRRCSIAELHDEVSKSAAETLRGFAAAVEVELVDEDPSASAPIAIAIVGMSAILPGSEDLDTFWENVLAGRDLLQDVPSDRFPIDRWYDSNRSARDKIPTRRGGFIGDIPFDPLKYGIPPKALTSVEPGQLLALELTHRALTDAGYAEHNPSRKHTGVIFGFTGGLGDLGSQYLFRALLPQFVEGAGEALLQQLPEWTEDSFPGLLPNVVAGRISNRFDLEGPNFTVDAACASSLAAVYLGCRELSDGTADMMIVGGCDVVQSPFAYLCFAKTGALTSNEFSRPFDTNADGISISEGLAAVVLKRLDDAERDGDRIYGVIRAAATGSDGKRSSLTAPCSDGQARTLERAYAQARFSPATVDLFEAHATGTALGDRTECQSVARLLSAHDAPRNSVAIGSVKSMIGHTKSAAGISGVVKTALALHHQVLPPTLNVETPNAKAGFGEGPLYVNSELRPWIRSEHPRRAGVSAFGFGGTNFHVVLEEYDEQPETRRDRSLGRRRAAELFLFAAPSREELYKRVVGMAEKLRTRVDAGGRLDIAELALAHHRQRRSSAATERAAIVATKPNELLDQLEELAKRLGAPTPRELVPTRRIFHIDKPVEKGPLAFLFPGQGSQYPNMLRDLALEFSEVRQCFEDGDDALRGRFDRNLSQFIFPPPAWTDAGRSALFESLKGTNVAQPALGVVDTAMMRLLEAFDVRPEMSAGHSYGELVALHAAGVMSRRTLFELSWQRGDAMVEMTRNGDADELGEMIAVPVGAADIEAFVTATPEVWIANLNSPKQTIVSGTRAGIGRLTKSLDEVGINSFPIPVACAFHSPIMAPAQHRFASALQTSRFVSATSPVFANTTAQRYGDGPDVVRERLSEQLVRQVRFFEEIEAMYDAGARVFLEVGPQGVLTRLVGQTLGERPHAAISTDTKESDGVIQLLSALGELFAHGIDIDAERLYEGRDKRTAELAPESLSPHTWLVNGSYARPAGEPKRDRASLGMVMQKSRQEGPSAISSESGPLSPGAPSKPATETSGADTASVPADAYSEFQATMRQFLATQESVMRAYFMDGDMRAERAEPSLPARMASPQPVAVAADSAPPAEPARPASEAPLADRLLEIVAERTGYPTDMLELDANLEAELGIDSIKRVEIIAAFRQSVLPELQEPPSWFVERMTSAVTLGAILEGVAALHVTSGASPPPDASVAPTPSAAVVEDLQQTLTGIVAERTGYPEDMLDLGANLEADLGIDSIKRVEIIAAFRQSVLPEIQEPPGWFVEQMTEAKTLAAILEGVRALTSSGPDPEPVVDEHHVAAKGAAPTQDLQASLTAIVSERTGYPEEMLALGANLEAELGIDSIKRVEIIAAFRQQTVPDLKEPPGWFVEQMTEAKTLEAILIGVEKLVRPDESSPPSPSAPTELTKSEPPRVDTVCARSVATVVNADVATDASLALPEGVVVLTDGDGAFTAELRETILAAGGHAVVLARNAVASKQSATSALDDVRRDHGPIGGLLHLLPLRDAPSFPGIGVDLWNRFASEEVKGLLFLIQALVPELDAANGSFVVASASRGGGDFMTGDIDEVRWPWRGGLSGLLKTAAIEWPQASFRHLDVDSVPSAEAFLRSILAPGPVEVGHRAGRRVAIEARHRELSAQPHRPNGVVRDGGVVVVTGGARGITSEVVKELARHVDATFVLLGRSPLPEGDESDATAGIDDPVELRRAIIAEGRRQQESLTPREIDARVRGLLAARDLRRTFAALDASGRQFEYVRCDIRDPQEFRSTLSTIEQRHGGIDAVIHGAGLIEDKLLRDKESESFDRVMGTKIDPMLTLVEQLDANRISLLLLFSSVAGFFGNRGQADYVAANEIINRVARRLDDLWPGRVLSLNWGPWIGAGTMVSAEVAHQFESRGVGLVSVDAGRQASWRELSRESSDGVRILLGTGPWVVEEESTTHALPLLSGEDIRRVDDAVEITVNISPDRYAFLKDHVIDGKQVVPLAVALELMAEVAAAAEPGWVVTEVRELKLLSGIVIQDRGSEFVARAEPIGCDAAGREWRVSLLARGDVTGTGAIPRKAYEAVVRLEADLAGALPEAPTSAALSGAFPLSGREAYERWLFHGPRFQVIEALQGLHENGIHATIRPSGWPDAGSSANGWLIDPFVLDAGPQLAILWSRAQFNTTPLPSRIASYRRYAPIGPEPLEARFEVCPETNSQTIKANVLFLRNGRVVGEIVGLEGAGSEELNRISEVLAR